MIFYILGFFGLGFYLFSVIIACFSGEYKEFFGWIKKNLNPKRIKTKRDVFLFIGFLFVGFFFALLFLSLIICPILNVLLAGKDGFDNFKEYFTINEKASGVRKKINDWLDEPVPWKIDTSRQIEIYEAKLKKLKEKA